MTDPALSRKINQAKRLAAAGFPIPIDLYVWLHMQGVDLSKIENA